MMILQSTRKIKLTNKSFIGALLLICLTTVLADNGDIYEPDIYTWYN